MNVKTQIQSKVAEVKQQLRQMVRPPQQQKFALAGGDVRYIEDTGTVGRNTPTPSPKPSNTQPSQNGSNKKPAEDKGTDKYDKSGNYTGGRSKEELDKLADDPAHAGSKRPDDINQGLLEQKIGLGLEEKGKLKGPITRDPSGKSEFFDANGQAWDVKSFNSNFKPKKGGYTLQKSMKSIKDSLAENENVILDTTNMSEAHRAELLSEISKEGLKDNIILWP
ncbi:hypothetical protein ACIG2M_12480 [Lysinibacillus fusiformis]|uniref:hypothetical protein n=1 Tax=Lysinibacillus fusiformis TaxID=28031 RepID=UPI0037CBAB26